MFFLQDISDENRKKLVAAIEDFCRSNGLNEIQIPFADSTMETIVECLCSIADRMEQRIKQEHTKKYVTDDLEITFMRFCCNCMDLIPVQVLSDEKLIILFKHRHFGYAFFEIGDKTQHFTEEIPIVLYKTAYLSMAEFYKYYYGKFSDNETAIRLLCQYFKNEMELEDKEQQSIADALIAHIKNAGDPGLTGFAYKGLAMIREYIHFLPESIVRKILAEYTFSDIENNYICRKQVFTIITNYFNRVKALKNQFLYLDSVRILGMLKDICGEDRIEKRQPLIDFLVLGGESIGNGSLEVRDERQKCYKLYMETVGKCERVLRSESGDIIFKVSLEKNKKIIVEYLNQIYEMELKSDMDSVLNGYGKNVFANMKEALINSRIINSISYKLVYLNQYHGMTQQKFYFDKRFDYSDGKIKYDDKEKKKEIPLTYSSNINSIYAIVGKNGTGKTSLVNFLGNDFVDIMYRMEAEALTVSEIVEDYDSLRGAEFLVILEMNEQLYYISNIFITLCPEKIMQYSSGTVGSMKRQLSKMFYFSNKIDMNEVFAPLKKVKGKDVGETQNYSEQRAFSERLQQIRRDKTGTFNTDYFNRDLLFQLLYLRDHFQEKEENLKKMLWETFSVDDLTIGDKEKDDIIRNFVKGEKTDIQMDFFNTTNTLQYFSSGQYARFDFFAKLYWIVKGYANNKELIKSLGDSGRAYENETIVENDSAILFIDEGDLYYHPEWQRLYISDLCKIIEEAVPCNLQIIIATNSPFILSDIFEDNIIFLSEEGESEESHEQTFGQNIHTRSEERRGGKECRSRWSPYH